MYNKNYMCIIVCNLHTCICTYNAKKINIIAKQFQLDLYSRLLINFTCQLKYLLYINLEF